MKLLYLLAVILLLIPVLMQWQAPLIGQISKKIMPPAMVVVPEPLGLDVFNSILNHNLWDEKRGQLVSSTLLSEKERTKTMDCQLKGIIYTQLRAPKAMFLCANKLTLLQEGADLPDGSLLSAIHADYVVVEAKGGIHREYLFGKKVEGSR